MGLTVEALGQARADASQKQLTNVEFVVRDLSDFNETASPESFDLITSFDAIHDQVKPLNVLKGIYCAFETNTLSHDIKNNWHVIKKIIRRCSYFQLSKQG